MNTSSFEYVGCVNSGRATAEQLAVQIWLPNRTWHQCRAAALARGSPWFALQFPQGSTGGRAACCVSGLMAHITSFDHGRHCANVLGAADELLGGRGFSAVYAQCEPLLEVSFAVREGHHFLARTTGRRGGGRAQSIAPQLARSTIGMHVAVLGRVVGARACCAVGGCFASNSRLARWTLAV